MSVLEKMFLMSEKNKQIVKEKSDYVPLNIRKNDAAIKTSSIDVSHVIKHEPIMSLSVQTRVFAHYLNCIVYKCKGGLSSGAALKWVSTILPFQ